MKILLDESLPRKLKYDFGVDHEVLTISDKGWLGKKNGELLRLMIDNGFELFVTVAAIFNINKILSVFQLQYLYAVQSIIAEKYYKNSFQNYWTN